MSLFAELAQRLPDARLAGEGPTRRLVFEHEGTWLDARARESPLLEIFIRTARLPMTMRVRPRDRPAPSERRFDELFDVEHDDAELATLWLDDPAKAALCAGLWEYMPASRDWDDAPRELRVGGCDVHVGGGEVLITHAAGLDSDRLIGAVQAGAAVATRAHRLATAWLEVARGLGGTTTGDRWSVDGDFAATVERAGTTVQLDNTIEGGLRTRARARRVATDDDRWMLARDDVPRRARPEVDASEPVGRGRWRGVAADPVRLLERLRGVDALFDAAGPDAICCSGAEVALWWRGLVQSPAWLGPAVELLSRLAVDPGASQGPYR